MSLESKLSLGIYIGIILIHVIAIFIHEGGMKLLAEKRRKFIESRDQKRKGT